MKNKGQAVLALNNSPIYTCVHIRCQQIEGSYFVGKEFGDSGFI